MTRKARPLSRMLLILACVFAAPVLTLLDLFELTPEVTLSQVKDVYTKRIRGARGYGWSTYTFIETDASGIISLKGFRPGWQAGQYAFVTRSKLFGILFDIMELNGTVVERNELNRKMLAGVAFVMVLLGLAFLVSGFDIRLGMAVVIGQAVFLVLLWAEVKALTY